MAQRFPLRGSVDFGAWFNMNRRTGFAGPLYSGWIYCFFTITSDVTTYDCYFLYADTLKHFSGYFLYIHNMENTASDFTEGHIL